MRNRYVNVIQMYSHIPRDTSVEWLVNDPKFHCFHNIKILSATI